nr:hypothetical protein [Tanacetum cinerariifolium]
MEQPVIIAVNSCHVSKYRDYQLAATLTTYYYLNPNIPEAETSCALYKVKFLLKTLMEQNPQSYKGIRFTAEATVESINTDREWYYESCHQCSKAAVKRGGSYICLDHGPYKFKAYIADASGTSSLTFFTPVADKITRQSYNELVEKYKPANLKKIPIEILAIEGKTSGFQFHYNTIRHITKLTLDDIFNINIAGAGKSRSAE